MKEKSWSFLQKNDVVDIIAPASRSSVDRLEEGIRWVENLGLIPRVPFDIMKSDLFFAAPLEVQFEHLKQSIYSDSKAIWCLRGGYGSMRLVPFLKKLSPPKKAKLFIGFSDITSLHLFLNQEWNWKTIHGRTISQMHPDFAKTPDRKFLKDIIFGKKTERTFRKLLPLNQRAYEKRILMAPMTGGNLRIVQSSLGTDWELNARGKILFLEDVGERGYSIHRMLEQLLQAKILNKNVRAIVFGDFTEGQEKDGKDFTLKAIERFADHAPFPVLRGLPSGHGHEVNFPLPLNSMCKLTLGALGQLTCSYGGTG
jgi:muramoyltetrapeptide carboxypeptidase